MHIVPPDTVFVVTTNSADVPSSSQSTHHQRYFERPDVIQAYKAGAVIETPEVFELSSEAVVGSRLRVRAEQEVSLRCSATGITLS